MNRLLSLGWRKVAILGAGVLIAAGALAVIVDGGRDRAIAAAKKHGEVVIVNGHVRIVRLGNRTAVDQVLPLLKDLPELVELSIYGVNLTPVDLQAIGDLTFLSSVRLEGCGLSGQETAPLGNLMNVTRL